MDATAWTVIGVGVTLLVVNGAAFQSLRSEMRQVRDQISQLRERMAKLEGLLEGLREAVTGKRAA